MIERFKATLSNHFSFLHNQSTILVAVSGGVDSMVLTDLLFRLNYPISLAHCNFNLRGMESKNDATFVSQLAKTYDLPYFEKSFDTNTIAKSKNKSIQTIARNLRYDWFYHLLKVYHIEYLAVAHHLDDSVETFLINLGRGTGLEGLLGIPRVNHKIIRPLSLFTRAEVLNYAKKRPLEWREDRSNKDFKYLRNQIRHQLIPPLKNIHPKFESSFLKTIHHLQDNFKIVQDYIHTIRLKLFISYADDCYKIPISKLLQLNPKETYLKELFSPYGFTSYRDLHKILYSQSGKQIYSKTHRLIRDRKHLLLVKHRTEKNQDYDIKNGEQYFSTPHIQLLLEKRHHPNVKSKNKNVIYVDHDKLNFPITLRKWKQGDFFYPFGMKGKSKKLSKFFKDETYSILDKENQWLLCNRKDIIWVVGKRADDRFRVSEESTSILKISMTQKSETTNENED